MCASSWRMRVALNLICARLQPMPASPRRTLEQADAEARESSAEARRAAADVRQLLADAAALARRIEALMCAADERTLDAGLRT